MKRDLLDAKLNLESKQDVRRHAIDELLHRMTVAQTVEVRMQLCSEAKREIAAFLDAAERGEK